MVCKWEPRHIIVISPLTAAMCTAADLRGRSSKRVPCFHDFQNNFQVELTGSLRVSAAGIDSAGQLRDH